MQVGTEVVGSGCDSWQSGVTQSSAHGTTAEPMALQDARDPGVEVGLSAAPTEGRGAGLGQGCRVNAGMQDQCRDSGSHRGAGSVQGCRSNARVQDQ